MPPKRKAMAETDANKNVPTARRAKAAKTSRSSSLKSKPAPKTKPQTFKYSNANTLSKKPKYMSLQWPNFYDFINDKNQDVPEPNQLIDSFCDRVSDLGIPLSEDGAVQLKKLDKGTQDRNQDLFDMHIYSDWNGWGISECFENHLKDFNKDIFKKTVSPFKKWAYVEGITVFLNSDRQLFWWLNNEDGDSVRAIAEMIGLMVLTTYSALAEHSLFKPESDIKNIGIISLMLLEFAKGPGQDLDIGWNCEVVRMCDEAGIDLDKEVRKQVAFSKKDLKELRTQYRKKKAGDRKAAETKDWRPENDVEDGQYKMWYRWDWSLEYKEFKINHPGGESHNLAKWTKEDRKPYILGSKDYAWRFGMANDSDVDSDVGSE